MLVGKGQGKKKRIGRSMASNTMANKGTSSQGHPLLPSLARDRASSFWKGSWRSSCSGQVQCAFQEGTDAMGKKTAF